MAVKTKMLQFIAVVTTALFAVSCTTSPYYTAPQNYTYSGKDTYETAPYSSPAPASAPQLHPNAVPLIATGIAALALYGYSKERSRRKEYQRRAYYNEHHHGGYYKHGNHRYGCY